MEDLIRNIIREEFREAISRQYTEDEVSDAIQNKHFIHTINGTVYSPVKLSRDFVTGVNNDCEHVDIPLKEITLIQTAENRFNKQ